MAVYESARVVPVTVTNLVPVAEDVMQHFKLQGYEVLGKPTATGGCQISISKGDTFKAVLGMKTALNIEIEPGIGGTLVRAKIGIWGEQAVPTMIMMFVAWPVLLTQMWGLAQQAHLDDEALSRAEQSLLVHAGVSPQRASYQGAAAPSGYTNYPNNAASGFIANQTTPTAPGPPAGGASNEAAQFCSNCGAPLSAGALFCSRCGKQVSATPPAGR